MFPPVPASDSNASSSFLVLPHMSCPCGSHRLSPVQWQTPKIIPSLFCTIIFLSLRVHFYQLTDILSKQRHKNRQIHKNLPDFTSPTSYGSFCLQPNPPQEWSTLFHRSLLNSLYLAFIPNTEATLVKVTDDPISKHGLCSSQEQVTQLMTSSFWTHSLHLASRNPHSPGFPSTLRAFILSPLLSILLCGPYFSMLQCPGLSPLNFFAVYTHTLDILSRLLTPSYTSSCYFSPEHQTHLPHSILSITLWIANRLH